MNSTEHSSRRVGVLIPSSNSTMELEFNSVVYALREGHGTIPCDSELQTFSELTLPLSFHYARLSLATVTEEALLEMSNAASVEAQKLADAAVEALCYGCTSGSLLKGVTYAKQISQQLTKQTALPALTTSQAVLQASKALNLSSITILTPYIDSINALERRFFESQTISVKAIQGYQLTNNLSIGRISQQETLAQAQMLFKRYPADGLFLSCTNLRTFDILAQLECRLGVPVFSSNSASLFGLLRLLQFEKVPYLSSLGELFELL